MLGSWSKIWALYIPAKSPHENDEEEKYPPKKEGNRECGLCQRLMDMDIPKLSEMEFRITMVKMMCGLEKTINENINENIESLRAEMRVNLAEIKKSYESNAV